jgi:hypothetical protein
MPTTSNLPIRLYQSYKKINDDLVNMFNIAAINNDFMHQSIVCIPNISKSHRHIMLQAKAYTRLSSDHRKEFLVDIIQKYIRPTVSVLNTVIANINQYIEAVSNQDAISLPAHLLYFDKHELHYALDFYRSIHASIYEQLHIFMGVLLSY